MSRCTLTVVMPNYNHARYLDCAISGIVNQTRPPDEFLILDDASTDESAEIITAWAGQYPYIRFLRNESNEGVLAAHDKLYKLARGDYLYSAAADDDRAARFFELAMQMAGRYPQAGLIFGKMSIRDEAGNEDGVTEVRAWQEPLYVTPQRYLQEFLESEPAMQAMTGATVFRRSAFEEVGWCRPELGSFGDTFAVRAIALKFGACYVPERFHIWRRLPESFSQAATRNARQAIDVIARAEYLMRSAEFSDRFPEDYVRSWRRRQKWQTIWNYLLGDALYGGRQRPSFLIRNLRRVPRIPTALRLLFYQGDVSCYDSRSEGPER